MKVKRVSMTESCGSLNVPVRARLGAVVIAQRAFDFAPSWAPCEREDVLPAIDPLPLEAVGTIGQSVQFDYSLDGGATWKWFGAARPTKWYVVPDMYGLVPPGERYDLGLEKVLEYARGASTAGSIARRMNTRIAAALCYDPTQPDPAAHTLELYDRGSGQCTGHVTLHRYLCASAGIPSNRLFTWAGQTPALHDRYYLQGGIGTGEWVTFQVAAPANDRVEADPHFTFHVVTEVAGDVCDPSYGSTWLCDAIEMWETASQRTGPSFFDTSGITHVWECEHEPVPLEPCP